MLASSCTLVGAGKPRDLSQWNHWRQHRRGTVVATLFFPDGSIRTSYFVEPDSHGSWVIVEYTDNPFPARKWPQREPTQKFSCAEFERVEPDRLHLPLVTIPDQEPRRPEAYLLHPICSKGKNAKLW
jgi:hypothetical protein